MLKIMTLAERASSRALIISKTVIQLLLCNCFYEICRLLQLLVKLEREQQARVMHTSL